MRLLVVDWDSFFPVPKPGAPDWMFYDWGHSEANSLHYEVLWTIRAADFRSRDKVLPGLSGEEQTFWPRFTIDPAAKLYVADSNVQAAEPAVKHGITSVLLYDAHHDSGYSGTLRTLRDERYLTCENWTFAYANRASVDVVYPAWKAWAMTGESKPIVPFVKRTVDRGGPVAGTVNRIFVCRSPSWVPPWHDDAFEAFLNRCPVKPRNVKRLAYLGKREGWKESVTLARDLKGLREGIELGRIGGGRRVL